MTHILIRIKLEHANWYMELQTHYGIRLTLVLREFMLLWRNFIHTSWNFTGSVCYLIRMHDNTVHYSRLGLPSIW